MTQIELLRSRLLSAISAEPADARELEDTIRELDRFAARAGSMGPRAHAISWTLVEARVETLLRSVDERGNLRRLVGAGRSLLEQRGADLHATRRLAAALDRAESALSGPVTKPIGSHVIAVGFGIKTCRDALVVQNETRAIASSVEELERCGLGERSPGRLSFLQELMQILSKRWVLSQPGVGGELIARARIGIDEATRCLQEGRSPQGTRKPGERART